MPNNIVNADLQLSGKCNTFAEQHRHQACGAWSTALSIICNTFIGQIGVKMIDK